jgi:hypothetical protein
MNQMSQMRQESGPGKKHIEQRSLAMHRLIADKIRRDPALFEHVFSNLNRWKTLVSANTQPYLKKWERLANLGIEPCLAVATEDSERAATLRQSSPFSGILSHKERFAFFAGGQESVDGKAVHRAELEHIIRVAATITNEYEFVIVGRQAILASFPDAPEALLASISVDLFPLHHPELFDMITGSIGEWSVFRSQYGYYAQGVDVETIPLPFGWKDRLVKIQIQDTRLKIGYCLEPHDLAASKLAAGQDKDREFVALLLENEMVAAKLLRQRIHTLPLPQSIRTACAPGLNACQQRPA